MFHRHLMFLSKFLRIIDRSIIIIFLLSCDSDSTSSICLFRVPSVDAFQSFSDSVYLCSPTLLTVQMIGEKAIVPVALLPPIETSLAPSFMLQLNLPTSSVRPFSVTTPRSCAFAVTTSPAHTGNICKNGANAGMCASIKTEIRQIKSSSCSVFRTIFHDCSNNKTKNKFEKHPYIILTRFLKFRAKIAKYFKFRPYIN